MTLTVKLDWSSWDGKIFLIFRFFFPSHSYIQMEVGRKLDKSSNGLFIVILTFLLLLLSNVLVNQQLSVCLQDVSFIISHFSIISILINFMKKVQQAMTKILQARVCF